VQRHPSVKKMSICVIVSLLLVVSPVCGKQSGFTLFNLKQYTKEMTWKEAQKFCRDKHIDLATVTSDKVFLGLSGWIGLYKENENGTWKWSEGNKTSNYTNWSATEPNYLDKEDCVYMDKKSKMFNEPCRRRHELICSDEKLDLVWTGLRFLGDEWFWVGGEQLQYQNIPSCPTFRCGVLEKSSNKSFGIKDCNERNNFFCYKRPESRD
ncbi:unnamed protein product, partial [Menidia menidia]